MLSALFLLMLQAAPPEAAPVDSPAVDSPAVDSRAVNAAPPVAPAETTNDASTRRRLLVLDVKSSDLSASEAETLTQLAATRFARYPAVEVLTGPDIRRLVDLEAQKQTAGCDDDSSCLAEIAQALGAQLVLVGQAGRLGEVIVANFSIYDARAEKTLGRVSAQSWSLAELPQKLEPALDSLGDAAFGPAPAAVVVAEEKDAGTSVGVDGRFLALALGGGATAVAGLVVAGISVVPAILYGNTRGQLERLTRNYEGDTADLDVAAGLQDQANNQRALWNNVGIWGAYAGLVVTAVGAGAVAAAFILPEDGQGPLPPSPPPEKERMP
jgi:hypothetical protein